MFESAGSKLLSIIIISAGSKLKSIMLKQKRYVKLACGKMMAYERWGNQNAKQKVLCCHGWLDNANSFSFLGIVYILTNLT